MIFLLVYRLDNYGSILYSFFLKPMNKSRKETREAAVTHKITSDFILDLYAEAKKKRGKNREEAMEQVKYLSTKIGSYLARIDPDKDEQ